MRFMEAVRKKGATGIWIFAGVMLVSIIGGLGVGAFYSPIIQGDRDAAIGAMGGKLPVVSKEGRFNGVAMLVNDRPVSVEDYAIELDYFTRNFLQNRSDYELMLMVYGEVARKLVRSEVLKQEGEKYGVTVTSEEVEEQRNKIIDSLLAADEETTGNIVGDLARNLSKSKARREAFRTFLERNGMTNAIWEDSVRRELLVQNCQEKVNELANAEKEQAMNETRLLIDEKLEAGESFEDLAREYSEDSNAANGGDLNTWIFPGLLQVEEHDEELFNTPVGETTSWFEIPAGLQRFEVYDRREAEGPEWEEKKPELIQDIKDEKGQDYEPTDEEVADLYRAVKCRQIQLNNSDPTASSEMIGDLVAQAKVEINIPYVLAYQALQDDRLYTADDVSWEDLVAIASTAHTGENYDFEIMRPKWENRIPKTAEELAAEDAEAEAEAQSMEEAVDEIIAEDQAATEGDDASAGETATAEGEDPAADVTDEMAADVAGDEAADAAPVEEEVDNAAGLEADATTPLYALAIGYLKMGQAEEGDSPSPFSYWMVADTYMEWLETEKLVLGQQVDRPAAREEVDQNLAKVIDSDNYNAAAYAARGLNLAWLDRTDEAKESLSSALKYAANADTPTLDLIQEAYEKLDDTEGVDAVEEKKAAFRQEQLDEAIRNAQNNPGQSVPFGDGQLQLPDITDLENMADESGDTPVDSGAADGEASADDAAGEGAATESGTEEGAESPSEDGSAGDGTGGTGEPTEEPSGE